ncbi:MAG: anthranilate synthase component I [Chloroflexota bacterium]|nr:anthranilate synthase component I [Chloroflexota bacterium]
MYVPSLAQFRDLAARGNRVPVYREIVADLETPVSAYLKIARGDYAFLLESVEGGERLARYSFIGAEPYLVMRADGRTDPLLAIEEELARVHPVPVPGLPRFHGGAVGYLSYDAVRHFERLPTPAADPLGVPEAVFMFTDTLLVFDHLRHRIKVLSHARVNGNLDRAYAEAVDRIEALVERLNGELPRRQSGGHLPRREEVCSNLSPDRYLAMVERGKEYIAAGDIIQVVLAQRLSRRTAAHPFSVYRALRAINPSPYMYFLHLAECDIVGASPEMLVRVEDGIVETHPIAGTRPRGRTEEEDAALEAELRADEKERAEHIMLLDLGRNDIGRVALPGSVRVTQLMDVERYSHVMHLVSHVAGRLRPGLTAFDALRACFPAGTVSGAPKIRAMEIIAELEPDRRGPYAGAVGYISFGGNLDTAITIRTMVMKDGVATVQAGGGIVADSVPELEYQESINKATAVLRAIEVAEDPESGL